MLQFQLLPARILVVKKTQQRSTQYTQILRDLDCFVQNVHTQKEALQELTTHTFDIIILDIHLTDNTELPLLQSIHESSPKTIIVLITEKLSDELITKAHTYNVRSYLKASTPLKELKQHVQQLLQEQRMMSLGGFVMKTLQHASLSMSSSTYHLGFQSFSKEERLLVRNEEVIHLTKSEAELLELFIQHTNITLSYKSIAKKLGGYDRKHNGSKELIRMKVSNLRKKLSSVEFSYQYIETIREKGYKFQLPGETLTIPSPSDFHTA